MEIIKLLEIIKQEIGKRNVTQAKLCKILDISPSKLSEILSAKRGLSIEFYINFCTALRISPSDLLRKWEHTEDFKQIDIGRRNALKKTIDNMIDFGYGLELDSLFTFFEGMIKEDKRLRAVARSKKEMRRWRYLKERKK